MACLPAHMSRPVLESPRPRLQGSGGVSGLQRVLMSPLQPGPRQLSGAESRTLPWRVSCGPHSGGETHHLLQAPGSSADNEVSGTLTGPRGSRESVHDRLHPSTATAPAPLLCTHSVFQNLEGPQPPPATEPLKTLAAFPTPRAGCLRRAETPTSSSHYLRGDPRPPLLPRDQSQRTEATRIARWAGRGQRPGQLPQTRVLGPRVPPRRGRRW